MAHKTFRIGDPVFAKMKFSPWWPAKIIDPPEDAKGPNFYYIFFFGTNNCAWVRDEKIVPYSECNERFSRNSRSSTYKNALHDLTEYNFAYETDRILSYVRTGIAEPNFKIPVVSLERLELGNAIEEYKSAYRDDVENSANETCSSSRKRKHDASDNSHPQSKKLDSRPQQALSSREHSTKEPSVLQNTGLDLYTS